MVVVVVRPVAVVMANCSLEEVELWITQSRSTSGEQLPQASLADGP